MSRKQRRRSLVLQQVLRILIAESLDESIDAKKNLGLEDTENEKVEDHLHAEELQDLLQSQN